MLDVANIIRNGFDIEYVENWAKKLSVDELLRECFKLLDKNYDERYDS